MPENEKTETPVKAPNILEETKAAIEELKKANAEKKELLDREETLKAHDMLAGRSQAGTSKPVEETPKEYAKRILRGGK